MPQPPIRVYADTSVYGGVFDSEFSKASNEFFAQVRTGRFQLVSSALVRIELLRAPENVRQLFADMLAYTELVETTPLAEHLQEAYLSSNVVTRQWDIDALHVAIASVNKCTLIVSWNFKHIVHFQKVPLYNAVNVVNGYSQIAIFSPREVIENEEGI